MVHWLACTTCNAGVIPENIWKTVGGKTYQRLDSRVLCLLAHLLHPPGGLERLVRGVVDVELEALQLGERRAVVGTSRARGVLGPGDGDPGIAEVGGSLSLFISWQKQSLLFLRHWRDSLSSSLFFLGAWRKDQEKPREQLTPFSPLPPPPPPPPLPSHYGGGEGRKGGREPSLPRSFVLLSEKGWRDQKGRRRRRRTGVDGYSLLCSA